MKLSDISPQRWMLLIALSGIGMLVFGLYLQHVVGLNPCPMCIVQRYALIGVVVLALIGWRMRARALAATGLLLVLSAGFGAFTAARGGQLRTGLLRHGRKLPAQPGHPHDLQGQR